jgi:hypothetical protein
VDESAKRMHASLDAAKNRCHERTGKDCNVNGPCTDCDEYPNGYKP